MNEVNIVSDKLLIQGFREVKFFKEVSTKFNHQNALLKDASLLFDQIKSLKVSEASIFSDLEWNLTSLEREAIHSKAVYTINWDRYSFFPDAILFKMKLLVFKATIDKSFFSDRGKKDLSFSTIVAKVEAFMNFFNWCFEECVSLYGKDFVNESYECISDLTKETLENQALLFQKDQKLMKRAMGIFDKKSVWKLLDKKKPIEYSDLSFAGTAEDKKINRNKNRCIPKNEFIALSQHATYKIIEFLNIHDKTVTCGQSQRFFDYQRDNNAYQIFPCDQYQQKEILNKVFCDWEKANDKNGALSNIYSTNPYEFSLNKSEVTRVNYKKLKDEYDLLLGAAIFIIASYTGMRPTELLSMKYDEPLRKNKGLYRIKVRILKGKERSSLFNDEYLAIPIVLDAYNCIAQLRSLYRINHPYAFQVKRMLSPLTKASFIKLQKRYFNSVLGENGDSFFYAYVFRHNLAYQLFRAELGLPFISFALKHLVTSLDVFNSVSDVTLGYGAIGDQIVGDGRVSESLKKVAGIESIKVTLDPDGSYAGGGSEFHKKRLQDAFNPYLAAGYSKEEVFGLMYEQGYFLVNVGLTYCMANNTTEEFDEALPCVGSLRCNPQDCPNSVISEEHKPKWKEINIDSIRNIKELKASGAKFLNKLKQAEEVFNISSRVLSKLEGLNG